MFIKPISYLLLEDTTFSPDYKAIVKWWYKLDISTDTAAHGFDGTSWVGEYLHASQTIS